LEADAIIDNGAGCWAAFEVKLGARTEVVDEAAAKLLRLRDAVDIRRSGTPAALVVVTGSGFSYLRPDGVSVVPIGLLRN
ncbi:MAG: ATP-binding protein, partial [Propionibacteriaceae bacterium]|nr:ATP-binding protein [Propionibacteriaceae bacterium]